MKNKNYLCICIHHKNCIMKKLAIVFGLVFFSLTVFAQNKGDMYVLTTANASFESTHEY